jgi:uncharacterized protein (TIGR00369 family)
MVGFPASGESEGVSGGSPLDGGLPPTKLSIPFARLLGIEWLSCAAGQAELALTLRDELCNSWGVAHGGALMTLLDVAMASAARSPPQAGGEWGLGVVTVEMKTSFMRPAQGRLLAQARLLHKTASMAFCEASVFDAGGQLSGHATGTFKFLRGLPSGGREVRRLSQE